MQKRKLKKNVVPADIKVICHAINQAIENDDRATAVLINEAVKLVGAGQLNVSSYDDPYQAVVEAVAQQTKLSIAKIKEYLDGKIIEAGN